MIPISSSLFSQKTATVPLRSRRCIRHGRNLYGYRLHFGVNPILTRSWPRMNGEVEQMALQAVDLYPGFSSHRMRTDHAEVFVRVGGAGPPLVLLHGYPQTHACWHKLAPQLAKHFSVVLCDLPGYGRSRIFNGAEHDSAYSKRSMAAV